MNWVQKCHLRALFSTWLIALAWRWRIPERFFDREEYVSASELFLCPLGCSSPPGSRRSEVDTEGVFSAVLALGKPSS